MKKALLYLPNGLMIGASRFFSLHSIKSSGEQKNMIGLISAMDIELYRFVEAMENKKQERIAGVEYTCGKLMGKDVVICNCGVGKVNAAMHTQILIDRYHPDCIIQNGIAGSLTKEVRQLDLVIGTELVYHDMQDFVLEQFEPLEKVYYADPCLTGLAEEAAEGNKVHVGRIATGDIFVSSSADKNRIREYTGALCTEMEGCAVAHTAYLNEIPFIVVRSISDMADEEAELVFSDFQKIAADHSVKMMLSLISKI